MRSLLIAAACTAVALADIPPGGQPDIITIPGQGQVLGVQFPGQNLRRWLAVPFGASTDGANIFRPPQPRDPWSYIMDCTEFGAGCLSPHHGADVPTNTSQDCLLMNIYAPLGASGLPVMVFFNGGAFLEGSNEGPFDIYDGSYIASQKNVVVVSVNYRLGVFGWFSLADAGVPGNMGLLDQRAGLQWVQQHIALVGGDPGRVTVFGESAGAMSIGLHLVSPNSKGLFQQAIMESNPSAFAYKNLSAAAVYGNTFCQGMNCSDAAGACSIDCLRAAPAQALIDGWNTATGNVIDWILSGNLAHILDGILVTTPVIDGVDFPSEPLGAMASGTWASQVPLIIGTNSNEGETFIYAAVDFALPNFLMPLAYDALFGGHGAEVNALPRYNASAYPDGRTPLSNVATDYLFRCSSTSGFATAAVKAGLKAWTYRFDHLYSEAYVFPTFGLPAICAQVVCHASELPFVYHNTPDTPKQNFTFTPAEAQLSRNMVDYWTSFATYGDPNTGRNASSIAWPGWDPANRTNLVLNVTITTEPTAVTCDLWDKLGYFW